VRTERRACIFGAVVFIAVIAAPGLIQTVSELRDGEQLGALDVFRQPPTARNLHAYEKGLEATSLVVKQVRPWVQYRKWRLLADAGEKAVVGRGGWLFYRESVRYGTERQAITLESDAANPIAAIRSFRDQLQARQIRLLVVPVPNKESVYPEMLAKRAEGAGVVICEPTRRLLEEFEKWGIDYVDLFEVMRQARQREGQSNARRLYLAQDSHWSPAGARLAAGAVARRVLESRLVSPGDRAYVEHAVTVRRHGDLVEMLRVSQIERALEPETLTCLQLVQSDTGALYHDAADSEVLVLGDSFLRIYEQDEPGAAGFIAHLARELRRPVSSIVNDGGASTLVRQALARRPSLLLNKKLVIWEFAERDIRFGIEGWRIVPMSRTNVNSR
jgi:hypothetical protein